MNRLKKKMNRFILKKQLENLLCEEDSVNHSGARIKRKKKTFKIHMAPETKRIYSFTDEQIYFSKRKQKSLTI